MKIILLVAAALVATSSATDSKQDAKLGGDAPFPSFFGTFGSRIAMADNLYDDDSDQEKTNAVDEPPKPCCFPDVWEGRVWSDYGLTLIGRTRRAGETSASRALSKAYVDGANKRIAGDVFENIGLPGIMDPTKWINISYVFQFKGDKTANLYLFDRKAEKCRLRELKNAEWAPQCIPPTAAYGGKLSLGPGAGGLAVEAWMFAGSSKRADALVATPDESDNEATSSRRKTFLGASVLVQSGSCIPVVIQDEGTLYVAGDNKENYDNDGVKPKSRPKPRWLGETFVGSTFFSDLKTNISDPSVFNVPSFCTKESNTLLFDDMGDEIPAVLGRFLGL